MSEKKMIPTRDGFGREIVELGKKNSDILVVDIDIGKSCKTGEFRKELPDQYINVGIAEQNGAGFAAGLATCGKIPFVVTYAVFGSLRMCEMIRQEICYPNLNVKIACSHGGVTPAHAGASHQSIESHQIRDGKDGAIIANGDTVRLAIEAAETLEKEGISARVLDMHTIKPLDVEAVTAAVREIGKVITVEDHNILNGLGSAVCEVAAEMGKGLVKRVGIQDQFGQSAPYERLLEINGITAGNIVKLAKEMQ